MSVCEVIASAFRGAFGGRCRHEATPRALPLASPLERRLALSTTPVDASPWEVSEAFTLSAQATESAVYVSARVDGMTSGEDGEGLGVPFAGSAATVQSHDLIARAVTPVSGEILSLAATEYREIEVDGVTVSVWRFTLPEGMDPTEASFRFELDADAVVGPVLPTSLFSEASITLGETPPPAMMAAPQQVQWHHTLPQATFIGTLNNHSWVSANGYTMDPSLNIHDKK